MELMLVGKLFIFQGIRDLLGGAQNSKRMTNGHCEFGERKFE
jgi:hypothetical protein